LFLGQKIRFQCCTSSNFPIPARGALPQASRLIVTQHIKKGMCVVCSLRSAALSLHFNIPAAATAGEVRSDASVAFATKTLDMAADSGPADAALSLPCMLAAVGGSLFRAGGRFCGVGVEELTVSISTMGFCEQT